METTGKRQEPLTVAILTSIYSWVDTNSLINEYMSTFTIRFYANQVGDVPLRDWLSKLRDESAKIAILRRIARMEKGNFGDHKYLRDGVSEIRIDNGPGYRIYYARSGQTLLLLLGGGSKQTQSSDITQACGRWHDWNQRQ